MSAFWIAIDGASKGNPSAAGIGVVVYNQDGEVVREVSEYIGKTTNNVAEYTALIRGLEVALDMGATSIRIQTDSELLAKQIAGLYKVKAEHLAELYHQAKGLLSQFEEAKIRHVLRGENKHADRLASGAASNPTKEGIKSPCKSRQQEFVIDLEV